MIKCTTSQTDYMVVKVTDKRIYVSDLNLGRGSIIHDAENVCRDVVSRYGDKKVIARHRVQHPEYTIYAWVEFWHVNGEYECTVATDKYL